MKRYLQLCVMSMAGLATMATLSVAEGHEDGMAMGEAPAVHQHDEHAAGEPITVTGEIVDLACYLDHNAQGEKHRDCAETCIRSGLPVGIKAADGKTYLVIGEHASINATLAPLAAQTVTIRGKLAERGGLAMIANAEIVKP